MNTNQTPTQPPQGVMAPAEALVKRLRMLLAEGTETPWQPKGCDREIIGGIDGPNDGEYDYTTVAEVGEWADVHLIVEAVNALPGLLDEVEALRARMSEDREILDAVRDALGGGPYDTLATRSRALLARCEGLEAERDALREFGKAILSADDPDGGDVQDLAVKFGLLKPVPMIVPCKAPDCTCSEFYDDGDVATCYRRTPLLRGFDWLDTEKGHDKLAATRTTGD